MHELSQSQVDARACSSRERLQLALGNPDIIQELASAATMLRAHALMVPEQKSTAGIWLDPTSILAHSHTTQKLEFLLSLLFSGLRSPLATVSNGGLVIGCAVASVLQCAVLPLKKKADTPFPRICGKAYTNSTAVGGSNTKQLAVCVPDIQRVVDPNDVDSYVVWLLDDMKDRGRTLEAARELVEGIAVNGVSLRVAGAIVIVERQLEDSEENFWPEHLPVVALLKEPLAALQLLAQEQSAALSHLGRERAVTVINGLHHERR